MREQLAEVKKQVPLASLSLVSLPLVSCACYALRPGCSDLAGFHVAYMDMKNEGVMEK